MGCVRRRQGARQLLSPARMAHRRRARLRSAGAVSRGAIAAPGRVARSAAAVLRPQRTAAFYDVLADNMHHKGAPIYGRRFIEELVRAFPRMAEVVTVNQGSRCVAGAVTLTFKGVMAIPFLSSRPDALWLRPNVLLVWD